MSDKIFCILHTLPSLIAIVGALDCFLTFCSSGVGIVGRAWNEKTETHRNTQNMHEFNDIEWMQGNINLFSGNSSL